MKIKLGMISVTVVAVACLVSCGSSDATKADSTTSTTTIVDKTSVKDVPKQVLEGYEVRPEDPAAAAKLSTYVVVARLTEIQPDVVERVATEIEEPTTTVFDGLHFEVERVLKGPADMQKLVVRQPSRLVSQGGETISALELPQRAQIRESQVGQEFVLFLMDSPGDEGLVVVSTSDGVARVSGGIVVGAGADPELQDDKHPLLSLVNTAVDDLPTY